MHYLDHGAREGRDPHPLFDTDYYLEHYGHLLAEGTNPLADFIEKGGYQGHHPSLAFDTTYYLEVNSDIAKANVIPVIHYLEVGITEGRYRWDSYKKYIENYLWPNWRYREAKNNISSFDYKPVFSIIMPVYNTTEKWLRKAIESVLEQIYPHWELCIADDCSKESHVRSNLEEFSARDSRIRVTYRDQSGHIATTSNTALAMATGEFVALMDHDDELHDAHARDDRRHVRRQPARQRDRRGVPRCRRRDAARDTGERSQIMWGVGFHLHPNMNYVYAEPEQQHAFYFAEDEEQLDKVLEVRERTPTLEKVIIFDMRA